MAIIKNNLLVMSGGGADITGKTEITARAMGNLSKGDTVKIYSGEDEWISESLPVGVPSGPVSRVKFSPDGTLCVFVFSISPFIIIYDTTTIPWTKMQDPETIPTSSSLAVLFSLDGTKCVIGCSTDPYLIIYDTTTTPWTVFSAPDVPPAFRVNALAFNHSGTRLAIGGNSNIAIYNTTNTPWSKVNTTGNADVSANDTIYAMAYSPDDSILMLEGTEYKGSAVGNYQRTLAINTINDIYSIEFRIALGSRNFGKACAFNSDGSRYFASFNSSGADSIIVYDTTTNPWTRILDFIELADLPANGLYDLSINVDNTRCVVACYGSPFIYIYDITTTPWTLVSNINSLPSSSAYAVDFNPDGSRCAVGLYSAPYIKVYGITGDDPIAYAANNNINSESNCAYGYAKEDIAQGDTGAVVQLFNNIPVT